MPISMTRIECMEGWPGGAGIGGVGVGVLVIAAVTAKRAASFQCAAGASAPAGMTRRPDVGHRFAASGVLPAMAPIRWLAAVLATALVVAGCSFLPGASPSARELALRQLANQQALWASKGVDDYRITIEKQCFCPSARFVFTVANGIVTGVKTDDGLAVRPDQVPTQPKTVPELFALVAGLPAEQAVTVSYDERFGFPSLISVDPIPNAVDDEYQVVVHEFTATS